MELAKSHKLILYSLGQFYAQLNQQLIAKPLQVRTSKIAFITFILHSNIITKKERAIYKNLESLETKKLIEYQSKRIKFTEEGINQFKKINKEIEPFIKIKEFFSNTKQPIQVQTMIRN